MNRAKADELYDKQFDEMLSFEEILTALDKAEARGRSDTSAADIFNGCVH